MKENRLSKVIAAAGICSRRKAEELIFEGRVKVNGKFILTPQTIVNIEKDHILIDEAVRLKPPSKKYFLLHKPKGFICSSTTVGHKKIVMDLFPNFKERLFTVGRLDKDTTGLLIVTNDGDFANQIIHPSSNIIKEYEVKTKNEITDDHIIKLKKGAFLDGKRVIPAYIKPIKWNLFLIGIKEGKKHEVRIITANAKLKLKSLKRTKIGKLSLANLPLGNMRAMTKNDKELIFA
jgi:23S rRNA pseudouridine2605 synthase